MVASTCAASTPGPAPNRAPAPVRPPPMPEMTSVVKVTFAPGVANVNRVGEPPITVPGYQVKPAAEVEEWVLAAAGARPADRDPVDARAVKDVRDRAGSIPASQNDVGGWPDLAENRRKLTLPVDPNGDDDGDGYTNLEEWLHGHAAVVEGTQ